MKKLLLLLPLSGVLLSASCESGQKTNEFDMLTDGEKAKFLAAHKTAPEILAMTTAYVDQIDDISDNGRTAGTYDRDNETLLMDLEAVDFQTLQNAFDPNDSSKKFHHAKAFMALDDDDGSVQTFILMAFDADTNILSLGLNSDGVHTYGLERWRPRRTIEDIVGKNTGLNTHCQALVTYMEGSLKFTGLPSCPKKQELE